MTPAIFQGCYANIVTRKTRGVCVIEIELPIEKMQAFIAAFGAPLPGVEIPVAIARIDPTKAASEPRKAVVEPAGDEPPKERRRFDTLPMAQQAAMRCNEVPFRRFLAERRGDFERGPVSLAEAADLVRSICGVTTRGAISDSTSSGGKWLKLNDEYQAWMRVPA